MADQDAKQKRFINTVVEAAQEAEALYSKTTAIMADLFANGYNSGGTAAITDDDFTGTVDYLTAADFYSGITAIENLKSAFENGGNIGALRKVKYE
jgi:hypothetical protein